MNFINKIFHAIKVVIVYIYHLFVDEPEQPPESEEIDDSHNPE